MARFVQMLPKSGIFADQNFMTVPKGGFNLIYLRDGKDFDITHDNRIDVHEVTFGEVDTIAKAYMSTRAAGSDGADRLLRLRTVMFDSVAAKAKGKLLQVRANGAGIPVLTARDGTHELRLDVAIMKRKEYSVAFKFVKHTTSANAITPSGDSGCTSTRASGCASRSSASSVARPASESVVSGAASFCVHSARRRWKRTRARCSSCSPWCSGSPAAIRSSGCTRTARSRRRQ